MKYADDFRRIAREALQGKWVMAVLAGLVAMLLGGLSQEGPEIKINFGGTDAGMHFKFDGQNIFSTGEGFNSGILNIFFCALSVILLIALVMGVIYFILGSFIGVGYAKFNLNLIDGNEIGMDTLFAYFPYFKTTALTRLLQTVYIFLWSLLLVIPGIMAGYSYSMTNYILAENPDITPSEALDLSKKLMYGNRWRLFCLQLSFIGWRILSAFTFGIGNLFLNPYEQAATAAFYREISTLTEGTDEYVSEII